VSGKTESVKTVAAKGHKLLTPKALARRAAMGEVVGGGFFVFRRGKSTGRIGVRMGTLPFEHGTLASAKAEAERLAALNPGECYVVLEQRGSVRWLTTQSETVVDMAGGADGPHVPVAPHPEPLKDAARPMLKRIAKIDALFDAATGWGSWMASLANEREALVEALRKDFGLKVEHKWKARTETGGRTC
jgi:hypothetical protein